jgi:hypothetical protein
MLDIPTLAQGRQQRFLHSWCDLAAVTNIEARLVVTSFFAAAYRSLEKTSWSVHPDFSWAKSYQVPRMTKSLNSLHQNIHIFHYVGLGFPPPEASRIWMRDATFASGMATPLTELRQVLSPPCLLIFDCDRAAVLRTFLIGQQPANPFDSQAWKMFFAMFACSQAERLHTEANLPQNFFSCVLLSPDKAFAAVMGLKIQQGEMFNDLLELFAETIALDSLPIELFYQLFRANSRVAALWRRFLLAQRLMKRFGLHTQSIPEMPDMSEHHMWQQFEYAVMMIGKPNVIGEFSKLYQSHFERVASPSRFVRAFLTSLMQVTSERNEVLARIAAFMRRSPENCRSMGEVISLNFLGDFATVSRGSPLNFRNWCTVVSGLVLGVRSFAKALKLPDAIKMVMDPDFEDETRSLLMPILVSVKESQSHAYGPHAESTDHLLPSLFTVSPLLREWTALLINAGLALYQADPRFLGPSFIHIHAFLLLYDSRKYTRAIAVAILTALMAPSCSEFNVTLMRLAMKAAIDGSGVVRLAFAHCAA